MIPFFAALQFLLLFCWMRWRSLRSPPGTLPLRGIFLHCDRIFFSPVARTPNDP